MSKKGSGAYTVSDKEGLAEVAAMRKRGARPEPRDRDLSSTVDENSTANGGLSAPLKKR